MATKIKKIQMDEYLSVHGSALIMAHDINVNTPFQFGFSLKIRIVGIYV